MGESTARGGKQQAAGRGEDLRLDELAPRVEHTRATRAAGEREGLEGLENRNSQKQEKEVRLFQAAGLEKKIPVLLTLSL